MANFLTSIFGSRNQRVLRDYSRVVARINDMEADIQAADDATLGSKTAEFRQRFADGETLDDLLPEAFAVAREAARRTLGMRPFDVQLIGGMVLHDGNIAEMRTGEGKTLVATLPAYLNAISGGGVHVVTVNEYLAQRDADWMRPAYEILGLTVGVARSGQSHEEKKAAYDSDITYATNNELGFDYLRDNLAFSQDDKVQRDLNFAIVDEVDSILIDEARTPLIISGPADTSTDLYGKINTLIPKLKAHVEPEEAANYDIDARRVALVDEKGAALTAEDGAETMPLEEAISLAEARGADVVLSEMNGKTAACKLAPRGDYTIDLKAKQAYTTEEGMEKIERLMTKIGLLEEGESLYDAANIRLLHHMNAALRAHAIYQKDVEYIVKDGDIVIVDEFTGRTMPGRRWSDGLHQAIEAKEGVAVKQENQTIASITFQNYFRLYDNLSGMTGTADTEAFEFQSIYGLEVVVIPTHKPMIRDDAPDLVYLTQTDKFEAIVEDITDCSERGQPVLVGTTSIETSELLSGFLKKRKIKHEVLNAKQHEREAHIVQHAGRPGSITIATNMAGRGTDIVLGGNLDAELAAAGEDDTDIEAVKADWQERHDKVLEAGGLHIVGTERHESRRIDNQLRGRSGRQGDPGSSRFYLSMEDSLMRIFGDPERTKRLLSRAGMREGEAIESKLLSRQIERAQRKVEAHNFDIRKNLLEYDDVANDQRKVVYHQRAELMAADEIAESVSAIRDEVVEDVVSVHIPPGSLDEQWDTDGLTAALESDFGINVDVSRLVHEDKSINEDGIKTRVIEEAAEAYRKKEERVGGELLRNVEKQVMLRQLDHHWKEHLAAMDHLRQGIGLRSYAQKNPKQEYKREAFEMFGSMMEQVKHDTISILSRIRIQSEEELEAMAEQRRAAEQMQFRHAQASALGAQAPKAAAAAAGGAVPPPPAPPRESAQEPVAPFVREGRKIGRNEPCPCGSGLKYKRCHGKLS